MRGRLYGALLLTSCNGVFGLDEGQLATGGGGTAPNGGGPNGGFGGDSPTSSVGGGGTTSAMTDGGGGQGEGGACLLDAGLENGAFDFWSTADPESWNRFQFNASLTTSTAIGLSNGLSMSLADVGAGAYAGLTQNSTLDGSLGCVKISGDSKRSTGMGTFHASATFNGQILEAVLPTTADFQDFEFSCEPSAPVTDFLFRLQVDGVPEGGTVTVQMHEVRFDLVCCDGTEPTCPTE